MSSSAATDWPGQISSSVIPALKSQVRQAGLGWAGLAGGFSPRVRALSFCIVLAWIQWCGFCDSCDHIGNGCSCWALAECSGR